MQKETEQPHAHLKWFGIPAVFPFIRPHKKLLLAVIVSMALSSAIDAIFPLFQNYAITYYIGSGTLDTLPAFAASYLLLLLFQGLINVWGCYDANKAEVEVDLL